MVSFFRVPRASIEILEQNPPPYVANTADKHTAYCFDARVQFGYLIDLARVCSSEIQWLRLFQLWISRRQYITRFCWVMNYSIKSGRVRAHTTRYYRLWINLDRFERKINFVRMTLVRKGKKRWKSMIESGEWKAVHCLSLYSSRSKNSKPRRRRPNEAEKWVCQIIYRLQSLRIRVYYF